MQVLCDAQKKSAPYDCFCFCKFKNKIYRVVYIILKIIFLHLARMNNTCTIQLSSIFALL